MSDEREEPCQHRDWRPHDAKGIFVGIEIYHFAKQMSICRTGEIQIQISRAKGRFSLDFRFVFVYI